MENENMLAMGDKADVYLDNHFLILWAYVSCLSTAWSKKIRNIKNLPIKVNFFNKILLLDCFRFVFISFAKRKFRIFFSLCKRVSILCIHGRRIKKIYICKDIHQFLLTILTFLSLDIPSNPSFNSGANIGS